MAVFIELLQGGLNALLEYLSAHVLTCFVPAFFIAGAIAVFISQASVIKYLGPGAKKLVLPIPKISSIANLSNVPWQYPFNNTLTCSAVNRL